ncbi:hypothetical protein Tco_0828098 [Tanacetum coccineum]
MSAISRINLSPAHDVLCIALTAHAPDPSVSDTYETRDPTSTFRVLAKVGKVAYKLELTQELSRVHHTFQMSNLKKCYADEPLVMPLEGIHVD